MLERRDIILVMKPRFESPELKILRCLSARNHLGINEENHYSNLEKGYKGELSFDRILANVAQNSIGLNDLLLECNNTVFQIDSLIISSDTIYLFEVKNFEGDFYIEGDRWYSLSGSEIKNPLLQLHRNESLFRRLVQELGFNFSIESYLIFINSEFHLYQSPKNLPIVFPTQLNRFIERLKRKQFSVKNSNTKLANRLLTIHIKDSPYSRLPKYSFNKLEKGIPCPTCQTFYIHFNRRNFTCPSCSKIEGYEAAILRAVEEYKLLFPNDKITTNAIFDWCNRTCSKKMIRKILTRNFDINGHGPSSYYVEK